MKKGQVYEGIVERVDFPNKGIVKVGEETCIVKNSLPGQTVRFLVHKARKGKAEARLLEVMESSPLETGIPCSHFGMCGGCVYLPLPYEEQLRIKEEQVKKLLDQVLTRQKQGYVWEGIKESPKIFEYRNKMEFSFGDEWKGGPLALGMHKRGSFYDVVNVSGCQLVDEDYRMILRNVRDFFAKRKIGFFHRMQQKGFLRHLLVRKATRTGEILIGLVTTSQNPWRDNTGMDEVDGGSILLPGSGKSHGGRVFPPQSRQSLGSLLEDFRSTLLALETSGMLEGRIAGILHITNDTLSDVVKSDRMDVLYGQDYFFEELMGLRFKVSAFSFFQTNTCGAEVLYRTVREYVGGSYWNINALLEEKCSKDSMEGKCSIEEKGSMEEEQSGRVSFEMCNHKVVFDLYSGTGTIAQLLAPIAGKVIGVEIVEEAVEAARENARLNGLMNCEFIAGDVLKVLDGIEEKPDVIILDPPRDGIHPKALPKIVAYGVKRIVYISCKPTSLIRDLEVFLENGYVVEKAVALDVFGWTGNVETVCLLSKK